MPDETLVRQSNDTLRDARAQLPIEVHQRTSSTEQFLEALALRAMGLIRACQLACDKFQCINRNANLEGLAPCALRQDGRLQKIGNGFDEFDWIWTILHIYARGAMMRSRSISVSEARRAIMARSIERSLPLS